MDKIVLPEVIAEHVLRVEVSGGFMEVRFRHELTVEDVDDLMEYLEVFKRYRTKRALRVPTTPKTESLSVRAFQTRTKEG